ncbi:MAG TPA: site-specific DNA-methyltransferase [Pyrinomonadaceae bacterium]|nr:site-specific DNA-methyltransferase [Pyrinomonadaceae bacterium]
MVLTSPPYNLREGMENKGGLRVNHKGSAWARGHLAKGYQSYSDDMPYPEYVEWQKATLKECWRIIDDAGAIYYNHKPRVVRGEVRLPTALNPDLPLRQVVIWDRLSGFNCMSGAYMPMCEWILILAKEKFRLRDKGASGVGDVWSIPAEVNTQHEAPFPEALALRVVETTPAETVLDPFMGSGTTGVACAIEGRRFIGIEIEEKYCELAVARIKRAKGIPCDIPKLRQNDSIPPLFAVNE